MSDPQSITVRFRRRLPVIVHGGVTTWRIGIEYFDKNGSKAEVYAACLEDKRYIVITRGRAREVEAAPYGIGLWVRQGTPEKDLIYRIFLRAVRDGLAERVEVGQEGEP